MDTYMKRSAEGAMNWSIAMFPTDALAQDAHMSLSDFEDFIYRACFLNDENPAARWQELGWQQEKYVQYLKGKKTVHLVGQDTDLTLSIEGRTFYQRRWYTTISPAANSLLGRWKIQHMALIR